MANKGKFIDRSPEILTAGIVSDLEAIGVPECITWPATYNEALSHILKHKNEKIPYKVPAKLNPGYQGLNTEISTILQPPESTVFQSLLQEFRATQYASYFKAPLGKCRDPNPGLPKPMPEPKEKPSRIKLKDLVNPPKTHQQVMFEDEMAHDLYVKSHEDYYPGEQIVRLDKYFDINRRFGYKTHVNWRGVGVARALQWCNQENVTAVSSVLADFIDKKRPPVGKVFIRNRGPHLKPPERGFGLQQEAFPFFGTKELMSEAPPCRMLKIHFDWLALANQLRNYLKKHNFPYNVFLNDLQKKDLGNGFISEDDIKEICKKYNVGINFKEFNPLLEHLKIRKTNDGSYNVFEFWCLINWKCEFPDLGKLEDMNPIYQHWETEYTHMADPEILKKDTKNIPTLGRPSVSTYSGLVTADSVIDLESLPDETTVRALINPNIFTQYGLSHRDFFLPRKKSEMRELSEEFGWKIPDKVFTELWRIGCEHDVKDRKGERYIEDKCCLETFRNLLDRLIVEHLALQQ